MTLLRTNSTKCRRAMTLLEVILAMTVMASISTLVAALWSQTRSWAIENASHQSGLRVERAVGLIDQQWKSRVLSIALGEDDAPAIALTDERLSFITTTPIFFHEAPMVRVVYRIERRGGYLAGEDATFSLEYEESPVTDPRVAVSTSGASGGGQSKSLTLLKDASALRWERWDDPSATSSSDEPARWVPLERGEEVGVGAAVTVSSQGLDDLNAAAERARAQDENENPLRAGRLTGTIEGDEIAWLFVAAPSRS